MKTGIIPLTETDRDALTAHLLSLDGTDRYYRFFRPMTDSMIRTMMRELPMKGLYGYWVAGDLTAVAFVMPSGADRVEFAVSVDRRWRGCGFAQLLLEHGLRTHESDKAQEMVIHHLRENAAMAAVTRKIPALRRPGGTEVDVTVDLAALRDSERRLNESLCAAEAC